MNVLSLFDGISCARVALDRLNIPVEVYYASEIDKYAMQISAKNYPDIIQLGSVTEIDGRPLSTHEGGIDLLIGGSPCQDLSIAKKNREGLKGNRSSLFYEYVRILKEVKPKYFILENVASMPKEAKEQITKQLGVEPIMINAALVSAQNRKRLFWTNIPNVDIPTDREIYLKDIIYENTDGADIQDYIVLDKHGIKEKLKSNTIRVDGRGSGLHSKQNWDTIRIIQTPRGKNKGGVKGLDGKTPTLTSSSWEHNNKLVVGGIVRKLTPVECERLQGLPDNYTEGVSNTQRYKALGNAFNVDVVEHIISHLP